MTQDERLTGNAVPAKFDINGLYRFFPTGSVREPMTEEEMRLWAGLDLFVHSYQTALLEKTSIEKSSKTTLRNMTGRIFPRVTEAIRGLTTGQDIEDILRIFPLGSKVVPFSYDYSLAGKNIRSRAYVALGKDDKGEFTVPLKTRIAIRDRDETKTFGALEYGFDQGQIATISLSWSKNHVPVRWKQKGAYMEQEPAIPSDILPPIFPPNSPIETTMFSILGGAARGNQGVFEKITINLNASPNVAVKQRANSDHPTSYSYNFGTKEHPQDFSLHFDSPDKEYNASHHLRIKPALKFDSETFYLLTSSFLGLFPVKDIPYKAPAL